MSQNATVSTFCTQIFVCLLTCTLNQSVVHEKLHCVCVSVNLHVCRASSQSEQDENMLQMAGDDVDVPEELLKMVDEDATEEEEKDSILGQMQNLQNMDMDQIKEKASATVAEMKTKAEEKCSVM